jgi:hypothetical protein
MNAITAPSSQPRCYALRFRSLFDDGRGYCFPCDAAGHVDLDGLSERSRDNYFFARTVVGRDLALPSVEPGVAH